MRPGRRLGGQAALVLPARPGGCAGRVRRDARDPRPDRPSRRGRGGRRGHWRRLLGRQSLPRGAEARARGQVLRLRLRGRDDEGRVPRGRGGVRLDRALEAVHDGDDGAVPGEALPASLDPALRPQHRDERGRGRHDDGEAALGAGRARAPRRPSARARATDVDPLPARGGRRPDDVGGAVEAAVGVRREAGGRGARRARVARRHRRLDARQDPRRGPGGGGAARAAVPEPLRRPAAGPDPLRRPHDGRGPDHGRRHRRSARGRPLLRHDDLYRRGRGDRLVRVVERGLGLRRRDRERDRRARCAEPRRAARAGSARGADRVRGTSATTSSATWTRSRSKSRVSRASRSASASSASSGTSSTSRARPASSCGTGSSRPAPGPSGSSRSDPPAREGPRHRRPGHRLGVEPAHGQHALAAEARQGRLRRQARGRAARRSARSASGWSGSRWRTTSSRPRARRS